MDQELLTTQEVADILRVSQWWVQKLCREGDIKCLKPGRDYRITRQALDEYLNRND